MLKVHVNAPVMLIHKVLPQMISNRTGVIINVSSLAAFIPTAGNSMYSSTKSFLVNFTESLHMDVGKFGIRVQCLCPGFTRTDFHKNLNVPWESRFGWLHWMQPEEVVEYSVSCLNKGQVICIPGFVYRVISHLAGAVPRNLYYLIAHKMDRSPGRSSQHPDAILPVLK
jgi:short-subunit dehydrogenase